MSATRKAWLLYVLLSVFGSIGCYLYIDNVREYMWRDMMFQMEQDLAYPRLVINKPYNYSTADWSLWCAEFVLDGPKERIMLSSLTIFII